MENPPWRPEDCILETNLPDLLGFDSEDFKYLDNGQNGGPIQFEIPPTGKKARNGGLRTGAQIMCDVLPSCLNCGSCEFGLLISENQNLRTVTLNRAPKQ